MEAELRNTAEQNLEACRNQIAMIQNPSPVIIIASLAVAVVVVYIMFLMFIAPSPTGVWVDSAKNRYNLVSSKILGNVSVYKIGKDGGLLKTGKRSGAVITVDADPASTRRTTGAWVGDSIVWLSHGDTEVWNREILIT